jgi:hypothetical protein
MLDADSLPLRDPAHLFDAPHVSRHGVMMWLDLWAPGLASTPFTAHDSVYPLLGIRKGAYWVRQQAEELKQIGAASWCAGVPRQPRCSRPGAWPRCWLRTAPAATRHTRRRAAHTPQDALAAGQGWMRRVAESGQLVFDRARHADVLEYLWWMTRYKRTARRGGGGECCLTRAVARGDAGAVTCACHRCARHFLHNTHLVCYARPHTHTHKHTHIHTHTHAHAHAHHPASVLSCTSTSSEIRTRLALHLPWRTSFTSCMQSLCRLALRLHTCPPQLAARCAWGRVAAPLACVHVCKCVFM